MVCKWDKVTLESTRLLTGLKSKRMLIKHFLTLFSKFTLSNYKPTNNAS